MITVLFASIFVSNILLTSLVGFPFFDKKTNMKEISITGLKTLLITLFSVIIIYPVYNVVLKLGGWENLIPIIVILLVGNFAILADFVITKLKIVKKFEAKFDILEPFLVVAVASCLLLVGEENYLNAIFGAIGLSIGYFLVLILIFTIKPKIDLPSIPKAFKGYPIMLITIGLIGMILASLAGIL